MRIQRRTIILALSLTVLLLLAACGGAASSEQETVEQSAERSESTDTPSPDGTALSADEGKATAASPEPTGTSTEPAVARAETTTPRAEPAATITEPTARSVKPTETVAEGEPAYQIVTLLPPDGIPSIDDPKFYGIEEADREYEPEELILGVELEGEARAYSVSLLSRHEIVNDTLAGNPISVTW